MIGGCFANILMMLSADPARGYCDSKFYWIPESNTRALLALCTLLLWWNTRRIHGTNWFTSNYKKQKFPAEPQPSICQLCYLFSHTYMHMYGRKNRKGDDEKGDLQAEKARSIIEK